MANTFDEITDHLRDWVSRQGMFFVATAPLSGKGHVNLSPKGPIGSLRILGPGASPTSTWAAVAPRRSRTCAKTDGSSSCSAPSTARRGSFASTVAAPW